MKTKFQAPKMGIFRCKNCKDPFQARLVDRKRGWAKFCSKSCKAKEQERRTHQNREYERRKDGDGTFVFVGGTTVDQWD